MIERIRGTLLAIHDDALTVEVGGLALHVQVPLPVVQELRPIMTAVESSRPEVVLYTHLVMRPDSWLLFGFLADESRRLFRSLLGIPGVGPRTALAVLSHLPGAALLDAITSANPARLESVPGIGKRMAGRIVHELAGKISPATAAAPLVPGSAASDALGALLSLGVPQPEAGDLIRAALRDGAPDDNAAELVTAALKLRRHERI